MPMKRYFIFMCAAICGWYNVYSGTSGNCGIKKGSCMKVNPFLPFSFTKRSVTANDLRTMHRKYGINRFIITGPSKSLRIVGYPGIEEYRKVAERLNCFKQQLADTDIKFSWWVFLTLKQGLNADYQHIVGIEGNESPVGLCPLDKDFIADMGKKMAFMAQTAKPELMLLEDDFSLQNYGKKYYFGCFCPLHLKAFAKKCGKEYTREELLRIFKEDKTETLALRKLWAETAKDSLVDFCTAMRRAVDEVSPDTRIGWCETGGTDADGNVSVDIPQALAGKNTRPLIRIRSAWYSSSDSPQIFLQFLAHSMYTTERMPEHFESIQEADAYPHTTYYISADMLRMSNDISLAMGMDNILFYGAQYGEDPMEDPSYLEMYKKNVKRFEALSRIGEQGKLNGVRIVYDPMAHSAKMMRNEGRTTYGHVFAMLARWGIPFSTRYGKTAILAGPIAGVLSDAEIQELFKHGLLLDAEAAAILNRRGYGELMGVSVRPVKKIFNGELICDLPMFKDIKARNISNSVLNPAGNEGSARHKNLIPHKGAEILTWYPVPNSTEMAQPGLVRFTNRLGGRVCVIAAVFTNNFSANIFSLRKQKVIAAVLEWLNGAPLPAVVKNSPNMWLMVRKSPEAAYFILTNVSTGSRYNVQLKMDPEYLNRTFEKLQIDGTWKAVKVKFDAKSNTCTLPGEHRAVSTEVYRVK